MSRPLRIEYPGAWYHVMNRRANRQSIFQRDQDYQAFLTLVNAYTVVSAQHNILWFLIGRRTGDPSLPVL